MKNRGIVASFFVAFMAFLAWLMLSGQAFGPTTRTPRLTVGPGPTTINGTLNVAGATTTFTNGIFAPSFEAAPGSNLLLRSGTPLTATSAGTLVDLLAGDGGATSGDAGSVLINAGTTTDGNGGTATIGATSGAGINRNGGALILVSGARTGVGIEGLIEFHPGGGLAYSMNAAGALIIAGLNGAGAGTAGQVFSTGGDNAFASWIDISFPATSASLGGGALIAGACASNATTVSGAETTMVAMASPNTYPGDGNVWSAQVTAPNTVTTRICAIIAATPTASTYNIRVIR